MRLQAAMIAACYLVAILQFGWWGIAASLAHIGALIFLAR